MKKLNWLYHIVPRKYFLNKKLINLGMILLKISLFITRKSKYPRVQNTENDIFNSTALNPSVVHFGLNGLSGPL